MNILVVKYKNILLLTLFIIISFIIGFYPVSFIDKSTLYTKGIYYWLITNIFLFLLTISEAIKIKNIKPLEFLKKHWFALFISFVLTTISFYYCKPEFRIFSDEMILLSDSQNLYETKECIATPSVINYLDGNKEILTKNIDKRPALFPFLVSIIHSLIGYSYKNSFILNYICGILILFFFYLLVSFKYGRFYGLLGLVFLSIHPLYITYVNSAGLDILNLLCSLIFFLISWNFIKTPIVLNAELLLLFMPLLAYSRYESSLITFIVFPFVFYYLPKEKIINFSYKLFILPLLYIPLAWLRTITNFVDKSDGMDLENPFALKYFIENFKQAIVFFFSGIKDYGAIPIISFMALIGFLIFIFSIKNTNSKKTKSMSFLIISFYFTHLIVKFSFCLGDITEVLASRHALIYLPIIVYFSIKFLIHLKIKYKIKKEYYIFGVITLFFIYIQDAGQNYVAKNIPIYQEFKYLKNYLEVNHKNKEEYLIICKNPLLYSPLGYNNVSFDVFNKLENNFIDYYKNKNCSYFLVLQNISEITNKPLPGNEISDIFVKEIIKEQKIRKGFYYRISKCYPKEK